MIKRDEIATPTSCLNKAADDEFVFVLREKDLATPNTIRFWIQERIRLGLNKPDDPKLVAAETEAAEIAERQKRRKA